LSDLRQQPPVGAGSGCDLFCQDVFHVIMRAKRIRIVPGFNKQNAAERLAAIAFTPPNRRFLDYWLSCHTDDGHLRASTLSAEEIAAATHATVTAEVKPGRSVIVKEVGPGIAGILSYDLLGADMIEMLPAHLRPMRLERTAEIARGVIAHNTQRVITETREYEWEEVIVPFGPLLANGTRRVTTHMDIEAFAQLPRRIDERIIRPAEIYRPIPLYFHAGT
jgi:hypothetical protein